ncbi:hypothetical protein LI134_10820, partial [Streptococcus parasanguinis]|uniref:hypothetical protein n=1 Tax=Streptococcus parasanguinis TaxID=1318 RepID=UPI001D061027
VYISFAYKGICSAIAVIYRLSQKMDCRWFFMKLCWYLKFNEVIEQERADGWSALCGLFKG